MPKIHYTRFPVTSQKTGKPPTCCGLVSDTANKSVTSRCRMELGKRHNTTDTADFCPRQLVTDLSFMLRTCCRLVADLVYEETGAVLLSSRKVLVLEDPRGPIFKSSSLSSSLSLKSSTTTLNWCKGFVLHSGGRLVQYISVRSSDRTAAVAAAASPV